MPWNGSGVFNRTTGIFTGAVVWADSKGAGRTVNTDDHDTHDEDIATGLENCVTRDGQNQPSANLPMGTFRHINVGNAAARTDYVAAGQLQDQTLSHVLPANVGGTGDAITLSPPVAITAYTAGQRWSFVAEANNTGATTINVNALGTRAVQKLGQALVASDIETGDLVVVEDDGTQFQMLTMPRTAELLAVIDASGNEVVNFDSVASAVVELTVTNAATGNSPTISATGDDTNIDITYTPKGTGSNVLGGPMDTNDQAINFSEGSAVASAGTTDIWATDGNTLHITGTTTITSFGTAPRVGATRWVIFDGILTLTHGANLNLPGSANITTAAGDFARVYADTTTQFDVQYFKADGTSVTGSLILETEQSTGSGSTFDFTGIPASTKRITVEFDRCSLSGGNDIAIQLGDSGGLETSGYTGRCIEVGTGSVAWSSSAIVSQNLGAGNTLNGIVTIVLMDEATDKWMITGTLGAHASGVTMVPAGIKALSDTLTQLRILQTGASTFDGGSVNILYEG